jgi:hypothetical protein
MPIDLWNGWQKPSDLFRASADDGGAERHDPVEWSAMWTKAKELASRAGWEGDIRSGPFVTVLPEPPGTYGLPPVVIGWKQDNNGTTFIAASYELPWLAADCDSRIEG